jgi:Flp pilus assembly pilin Flp
MLVYVEHILSMAGIRLSDEEGQGLVEYVLIIGLIAILLVGGLAATQGALTGKFGQVSGALT